MKKTIIFILIFLLSIQFAHAKARFMGLEEVVAVSDFIGIVEVNSSERIGKPFQDDLPQKGYWKYSQKNTFKILSIIKRSPLISVDTSKQQTLWAEKSFICASASYNQGKYLVFLESVSSNEWITLNHHFGALLAEENKIDFSWYSTDKSKKKESDLGVAEEKIREHLLNTPSFTIEADIPADLMYNSWKEKQEYQKIWFHVYDCPKENWPNGLTHFVRAFVRIDKVKYQSVTIKGGIFSIVVHWQNGNLMIDEIK